MRNDSIDNIRLDINREKVRSALYVREGDTISRTIHCTLADNGKVIDLSDAYAVQFTMKKADGTEVDNGCVIDGDEIQYTLRTNDVSAVGENKAQFIVTFNDMGTLTSPEFSIYVYKKTLNPNVQKSFNEYGTLLNAVQEAQGYAKQSEEIYREVNTTFEQVTEIANDVSEAEARIEVAEASVKSSEENARTSEINAMESEQKALNHSSIANIYADESKAHAEDSKSYAESIVGQVDLARGYADDSRLYSENAEASALSIGDAEARVRVSEANAKASEVECERLYEEISSETGKVLEDAKKYADEQDLVTLKKSKDYTDEKTHYLQEQIDGAIETYTTDSVPTIDNYPASSWKDDTERDKHIGDVCFVTNVDSEENGFCYRFSKTNNVYGWTLIKDSDVTKALSDISGIKIFDESVVSFMTKTDLELSSVKSRTSIVESNLGNKVDKSTFNTLSQTVDENSASITTLGETVSKKADGTTVTTLSNTVNEVKQTADANKSSIAGLTKTVESKADGSTVTALTNRVADAEQSLDGFKTTVSQTYQTKDAMSGYSTTEQMNTAISQSAQGITQTVSQTYQVKGDYSTKTQAQGYANTAQSNAEATAKGYVDNLEVGGRNYFKKTSDNKTYPKGHFDDNYEYTLDSYQSRGSFTQFGNLSKPMSEFAGKKIKLTFDIISPNGETSLQVYNNNGNPRYLITASNIKTPINNKWVHQEIDIAISNDRGESYSEPSSNKLEIYCSQQLGCKIRKVKFEIGTKATDWTPAPEDMEERVSVAESSIQQNADNIELKVSKDGVISSINQSPESIKISADKIDIVGKVTFSSLDKSTQDTINGKTTMSAVESKGYATTTQAQGYANTAQSNAISTAGTNADAKVKVVTDNIYKSGTTTIDGGKIATDSIISGRVQVVDGNNNTVFDADRNSKAVKVAGYNVSNGSLYSNYNEIGEPNKHKNNFYVGKDGMQIVAKNPSDSTLNSSLTFGLESDFPEYGNLGSYIEASSFNSKTEEYGRLHSYGIDVGYYTLNSSGQRTIGKYLDWSVDPNNYNFWITDGNIFCGSRFDTEVELGASGSSSNRGVYDVNKSKWIAYMNDDSDSTCVVYNGTAGTVRNSTNFRMGSCSLNSKSATAVEFSSAMGGTPRVFLQYTQNVSGDLGALKVTARSASGFSAIIGGTSSATNYTVSYLAVWY